MTKTKMYQVRPNSATQDERLFSSRDRAESYLAGLVSGGEIVEIDADETAITKIKVERSYQSDRLVLLITQDVLEKEIRNCRGWASVENALSRLAERHGASSVGCYTQYLGADGQMHLHRWLDGCQVTPASKPLSEGFYHALSVATASGYRVAAIKHGHIG